MSLGESQGSPPDRKSLPWRAFGEVSRPIALVKLEWVGGTKDYLEKIFYALEAANGL